MALEGKQPGQMGEPKRMSVYPLTHTSAIKIQGWLDNITSVAELSREVEIARKMLGTEEAPELFAAPRLSRGQAHVDDVPSNVIAGYFIGLIAYHVAADGDLNVFVPGEHRQVLEEADPTLLRYVDRLQLHPFGEEKTYLADVADVDRSLANAAQEMVARLSRQDGFVPNHFCQGLMLAAEVMRELAMNNNNLEHR